MERPKAVHRNKLMCVNVFILSSMIMYVPEGRTSDRSLSCRCLAGNPATPGSVRRTRRPTTKERGKKKGRRWNWKENKEGDNVDQNKKKQTTNKTNTQGKNQLAFTSLAVVSSKLKIVTVHYFIHSPLDKEFRMQ